MLQTPLVLSANTIRSEVDLGPEKAQKEHAFSWLGRQVTRLAEQAAHCVKDLLACEKLTLHPFPAAIGSIIAGYMITKPEQLAWFDSSLTGSLEVYRGNNALVAHLIREAHGHVDAMTLSLDKLSLGEPHDAITSLNLADSDMLPGTLQRLVETFPQLRHFDLTNCKNISNQDIAALKSLQDLRSLFITAPSMTNEALAYLGSLPHLEHLKLHRCRRITDEGLAHLAKLSSLKQLSLELCDTITCRGIARLLSQLTALTHLHLEPCEFMDVDKADSIRGDQAHVKITVAFKHWRRALVMRRA